MKLCSSDNHYTTAPQLAIFVRGTNEKLEVMEELAKMEPLMGTTAGRDVLNCFLRAAVKTNLDLRKLISVTTDGAPVVVGRINGFISILESHFRDNGINHSLLNFH